MEGTGTGALKGICDFRLTDVRPDPFPHVVNESFITPDLYRQLSETFPLCRPGKSPTGFSLYWEDAEYQQLLNENPAWRELFASFDGQAFIEWGCNQFADVFRAGGCKINPAAARYVPYREDRIDKERATLRRVEYKPHELWVRMDIHQGRPGYFRPIHLDHARRLISMLIYFCDHTENKMSGGELFLHGPGSPTQVPTRIAPRHNLMVAFPCANESHHSVSKITSTADPRNYIQIHISSSVDVWPRQGTPILRRALSTIKRRLVEA